MTVGELRDILAHVPYDAQVTCSYDSMCGGWDFDEYGMVFYDPKENEVLIVDLSPDMIPDTSFEEHLSSCRRLF